ncbi:hypothetical protein NL676_027142 [Syzygium grande]|nr:hypothetical protein NL676_027142 [Syzygium grande]
MLVAMDELQIWKHAVFVLSFVKRFLPNLEVRGSRPRGQGSRGHGRAFGYESSQSLCSSLPRVYAKSGNSQSRFRKKPSHSLYFSFCLPWWLVDGLRDLYLAGEDRGHGRAAITRSRGTKEVRQSYIGLGGHSEVKAEGGNSLRQATPGVGVEDMRLGQWVEKVEMAVAVDGGRRGRKVQILKIFFYLRCNWTHTCLPPAYAVVSYRGIFSAFFPSLCGTTACFSALLSLRRKERKERRI